MGKNSVWCDRDRSCGGAVSSFRGQREEERSTTGKSLTVIGILTIRVVGRRDGMTGARGSPTPHKKIVHAVGSTIVGLTRFASSVARS